MSRDCYILNPLQRDGLSQRDRMIKALHPSYVQVDERDISDILLYAREYAKLIRYFSTENNPSGDWLRFIESDVSTQLAIMSQMDSNKYKKRFDEAIGLDIEQFLAILDLLELVNKWIVNIKKDLDVYTYVMRVKDSILSESLLSTLAIAKRLQALDAVIFPATEIESGYFSTEFAGVEQDKSVFPGGSLSDPEQRDVATRKLRRVFQQILEVVAGIVDRAHVSIINYPNTSPT